jgi:hypothetical protein
MSCTSPAGEHDVTIFLPVLQWLHIRQSLSSGTSERSLMISFVMRNAA